MSIDSRLYPQFQEFLLLKFYCSSYVVTLCYIIPIFLYKKFYNFSCLPEFKYDVPLQGTIECKRLIHSSQFHPRASSTIRLAELISSLKTVAFGEILRFEYATRDHETAVKPFVLNREFCEAYRHATVPRYSHNYTGCPCVGSTGDST